MERGTHGARGPTMSIAAMRALLSRMGDPQSGRRTVHVTGSKGKGSTSTMVASILKAAGFKTALYTSPHLHSYTERIAFDLVPVSQERFAEGVSQIQPYIEQEAATGASLSTFGLLTALFFWLTKTADKPVDWQIVEVGMGGRYDATNVFDQKDLAIITPISLEHIEVLGINQTEIARNKAGIIIPGSVAVLSPQRDPSVRAAIGRQCHEVHADLIDVGKSYKIASLSHDLGGQTFTIDGPAGKLELKTPMLGHHQVVNAATAAVAGVTLRHMKVPITNEHIALGLAEAQIYGRFEVFAHPSKGSEGPTIVGDGAHNHESAAALATALKTLFKDKQCIFIIGVNMDKNINAIWRELQSLHKFVIVTQSKSPRAMDTMAVAEAVGYDMYAEHDNHRVKITKSVEEAVKAAKAMAGPDDLVCVTGSLYVVAEARELLLKDKVSMKID